MNKITFNFLTIIFLVVVGAIVFVYDFLFGPKKDAIAKILSELAVGKECGESF